MQLLSLDMQDFRNYAQASFRPCAGLNLVRGENAAGKTNLLEAIYFALCGCSFRTVREKEAIRNSATGAVIRAVFLDRGVEKESAVQVRPGGKTLLLNGKEESRRAFPGEASLFLFRPEDLQVVSGAPVERRRFLDGILSGIVPGYRNALQRYFRAVGQRNALLRQGKSRNDALPGYDTWTEAIVETGSVVLNLRIEGFRRLAPVAASLYRELTGRKLVLRYLSTVEIQESIGLKESFLKKILSVREQEVLQGQTLAGPHRDDLLFLVENQSLRGQGSRGEQRAAVLAVKLAEAQIRAETSSGGLLYLLDDVFSELGPHWRAAVLDALKGHQAFITTADPAVQVGACSFRVEAGDIRREA
ncbi:MAG: DNA replication and repair protein RecF [Bacillota bacterium]|nr:DNA replication and repair protein RecF [Thermoanaerobacteraceae bacterium]